MIAEDRLEQLVIQWFQDTGWNNVHRAGDRSGSSGGSAEDLCRASAAMAARV